MGAYENPRFIPAPDYTVGFKAFEEKFQKGYEQGMQRGRDLVEQDKNYIAGIEDTADQMRLEGEIAIENGLKTKEAVETELAKFYEKAMRVDKGGKGLGGIFSAKRLQMGDVDIRQELTSFKSAIAPLNTMYDKIYLQDYSVQDDEDQSNPDSALKNEIVGAVKAGRFDSGFDYNPETKGGGFSSGIEYTLPDGTVKKIAGTELARLFGNDTSEDRIKINERHEQINTNVAGNVTAAVANKKAGLQVDGSKTATLIKPIDVLDESISNVANTAGFYNKDGLSIQPDDKGNYTSIPEIGGDLDKLWSNHAMNSNKLSEETKLNIFKRTVPALKYVDNDKLLTILNGPMGIGTERLKNILGDNFESLIKKGTISFNYSESEEIIKSIHDGQAVTKAVLYHETVKKGIMDKGLINQAYIPPATSGDGSGSKFDKNVFNVNQARSFAQQQLNKTLKLPTMVLPSAPGGLGGGGGSTSLDVNKLGFDEIKITDGSGNFVNKAITGSRLSSNGLLKIEYEQEAKTVEVPTGETDEGGNPIMRRVVSAPKVNTNNYNIYTLNGLENLFKDIGGTTTTQTSEVESVYPSYFREEVYRSIQQNFEANPNYLKDPQTSELRIALIQQYGGVANIKQGGAASYPQLYKQDWFLNILRSQNLEQ